MRLRPVNDCLLAEPLDDDSTANGLLISGEGQQPLQTMRVIYTPEYVRDNDEIFLKGDKVVTASGSGIRLILNDKEVTLLRQRDILAVLE